MRVRSSGGSILFQLGGLVLATIAAVLAISFGVVSLTPPPPSPRMSLAEVRAALLGQAKGPKLERTVLETGPLARRSRSGDLFAAALAHSLGVARDDVRVRFTPDNSGAGDAAVQMVSSEVGHVSVSVTHDPTIIDASRVNQPLFRALLDPSFSLPAFEAAMRRDDGRWVLVRPGSPWLSVWRIRLFTAFALSALLLVPLARWAARRLTSPIRALAEFADRADLADGATGPPTDGPREIRAAGAAIEDMRRRLNDQAAERTRMLAAVAHDLRTPLTGLRLRAGAAPKAERTRMAADIDRMEAMIAQVLAYAAGEEVHEPYEKIDIVQVVRDCRDEFEARGGKVRLVQSEHSLSVDGDRLALRRAVSNLVDNAVRYGGSGEISVVREGRAAVIRIEDCGPGLPDALLEKVKEPFFRAEQSRSRATGGTGLGLAIAKGIAARHGGSLVLRNREGGGLVAELRLPERPPAL